MFEEQISDTREQEYCFRETHPIYSRNKNIASEEQTSSIRGTQILCLRKTYRLLRQQEYCVQENNLFYVGNKNIMFKKHILSTQETRILCQ
jgi:hypothetical protein